MPAVEAFVVRNAIRRAQQQYGKTNVRVSSQFARMLAENSAHIAAAETRAQRGAFLAPINGTAITLDERNAMWFRPGIKMSRSAIAGGLIALNKTRRQCGLDRVYFTPRPTRTRFGVNHVRSVVARSIARYFYTKHYMRVASKPGQTTVADIDHFLNFLDDPPRKRHRRSGHGGYD